MISDHLPYWLAAMYLPGVGPRTFIRWMEFFPTVKTLFHASNQDLHAAGIDSSYWSALHQIDWARIDNDVAWARGAQHHLISIEDARYPRLLKEIADPPLILFAQGNVGVLSKPQVAIVGARHATPTGLENAKRFAYLLAERGYVVTSGLALGIDAASHRGALAAGGITIGVCGTGLDCMYPPSHQSLAAEMVEKQGLVISEFPLGTKPLANHFPRRNRIISGLSLGVLVVEAALKSGSLITARQALDHGREVFAIPGSIHNQLTRGCHHLIRQGAKLVETVDDITEELSEISTVCAAGHTPAGPAQTGLSQAHRQLLDQIGYEITPLDVILWRSGLTAGELSSMLLILELYGYIQSVRGGYMRTNLDIA